MRQHNKYLVKVQDELDIYQRYLIDETAELSITQIENFEKIESMRAWLREGFSDSQVLAKCKRVFRLQDRRSRELLAMAYACFAELRASRDKSGVKFLYAEMFKQAAKKAEEAGDYRAVAVMLKEAAKIDGAYQDEQEVKDEDQKKPRKVTINVKKLIVQKNSDSPQRDDAREKLISDIQDIPHEVVK